MKKKHLCFMLIVLITSFLTVSCNKEEVNSNALNPNPTTVGNVYLIKATLQADPDGFNMVSEPGFELYPDSAINCRTLWWTSNSTKTSDAYAGSVALHCTSPSGWNDACVQSVALKKSKDYLFTVWGKGAFTGASYAGVRLEGSSESIMDTMPNFGAMYTLCHRNFNSANYIQGNVFAGSWSQDPTTYLNVDNFRLCGKGTTETSTIPTGATIMGNLINASYNKITQAGQAVIWTGPNNTISMALANVVANGKTIANAFASSSDTNLSDGFYISKFTTDASKNITAILTPSGSSEIGCIPTAGITIGNKQYIHYYSLRSKDSINLNKWTANFSSLLSSSDNGATWTKESSVKWSGSSNFAQVSFYQGTNYIYMFGSPTGRTGVNTYVARVIPGSFTILSAWEYWDGGQWVVGDPAAAAGITYGCAAEMSVTYNSQFSRYLMIYRSNTTHNIVCRDAGSPEGDWSGEKVLINDPISGGGYFAPSIQPLSTGNELYFIVSGL